MARTIKTMVIEDQKGATAIEFALALPLLIIFLFGIIEFGLLLYNEHILTNACREGARAGIVARIDRLNNSDIRNIIINYAASYLVTFGSDTLNTGDINIAQPDVDHSGCVCSDPDYATDERCLTFGCDLKVEVNYNYDFLVFSAFGFGPIPLKAVSVMRME